MTPSEKIDQLLANTADWRGKTLAAVRKTILSASKEIVEEWKWMGSPVWECDGIIAVGNAHKDKVKLTFDKKVLDFIVDKAFEYKLGARGLRSICEAIMTDAMYELPGATDRPSELRVTLSYAREKFERSRLSNLKVA